MFSKNWFVFISIAIIMLSIFLVSCNKKSNNLNTQNTLLTTKLVSNERYLNAKVALYNEKDKIGQKEFITTTISKGEKVRLIKTYEVFYQENQESNAPILKSVAEVQLSDGKKGFLFSQYLALKPIVILEEVQTFERPDLFSKSISYLKKGSLAFIMEFGDQNWIKINGKSKEDKNIYNVWICDRYTDDIYLVRDALDFDDAQSYLDVASKQTDLELKNKYYKMAFDILEKLVQRNSIVSQAAQEILEQLKTFEPLNK